MNVKMSRRCKQSPYNPHLQHRSMFLPIMICSRSSVKDVQLSRSRGRCSSDDAPSFSPQIGCSGQAKRNSKVTGLPLSVSSSVVAVRADRTAAPSLFSAKSLAARSAAGGGVSGVATVRLGKEREYTCNVRSKCGREDRCRIRASPDAKPVRAINVAELDPPLPVVRRPACRQPVGGENGGDDRESLWKRRSRAAPLRSLQVQSIHGGGANGVQAVVANTV